LREAKGENMKLNTVYKIDPQQAKRAIAVLTASKIPPVLVGPVGCGKTTAVCDFVDALNNSGVKTRLIEKILAQLDISNFSLPKEIEGRIHEICADWIPLEEDETDSDPYTVIFFDELDRCDEMVQNIILNIILQRKIAGKKISDKVSFVGAMNGSSDIYTTQLSKAAINRVCLLYIKSSPESYDAWAKDNGISPVRRAFQMFKAEEIIQNDEEFEDVSFPTNRSLDFVDSIDQSIDSFSFDTDDIINPIVAGLIGVPACHEYMMFKKLYAETEPADYIVENPTTARTDYEHSMKYAVAMSVVGYASSDLEKANSAIEWFTRLEPEYTSACVASLMDRNPEVCTCPNYVKYSNKNQY
jgi:MoxR-like ATPase